MQLIQEYSYKCESGYEDRLEPQHVIFNTKDLESNKTVCNEISGNCHTTTK